MEKAAKLKLRASHRDNRRYFVVNCNDNSKIEKAIMDYLGILGMAESAYMKVKTEKNRIIGSCLRESINDVHAALAIEGIKIEKISGTLKGLRSHA